MSWLKGLKGRIKRNEPLSRHTTMRVGGCAGYFVEPCDEADLKRLITALKKEKLPFLLIGSGSNLLVASGKIGSVVVKLSAAPFKKLGLRGNILEAGAGAAMSSLLQRARASGLAGLEFLAGIPGTVGAGLVMNAGIPGHNIGDLVVDVSVMDKSGRIRTIRKKDARFAYRRSALGRYIVLSARFCLEPSDKRVIRRRINELLRKRKDTQDYSYPSAGCVFKNPGKASAGQLIDMCGLKGARVGGACVSRVHGNFIINKGRAKAADIIKLMKLIQGRVKSKFNIKLEPEIKIW